MRLFLNEKPCFIDNDDAIMRLRCDSVLDMGGMKPLFGDVHNFVKSLPNAKCSYTLCIMSYHVVYNSDVTLLTPDNTL